MEIRDGKTLEGKAGKVSDWRKAGGMHNFVDYTIVVLLNKTNLKYRKKSPNNRR